MTIRTRKVKSGDVRRLTNMEARQLARDIHPGWNIKSKALHRTFLFPNFRNAMQFANKIAVIADRENHHPNLLISYGKVIVELSTHSVSGLSEKDFSLAQHIEQIK
ncbi:MAG: 4a-hydroxytetrahydrobiopterin dehydratase [Patescibacteria group bacterium]